MNKEEFIKRFNLKLNGQQEAAMSTIGGPLLLLAVPGSGKTTTLVCRIGYMIYVENIDPKSILVITFTKAAAADMRDRFISIFGAEYADAVKFRTINAFCNGIASWYWRKTGCKIPEVLSDNYGIIHKLCVESFKDYPAENDVKDMQLAITKAKNLMLQMDDIKNSMVGNEPLYPIFNAYQKYLNRSSLMDFDDQLVFAHQILKYQSPYLNALKNQFKYILVDEAQDTSKVQHEIIGLISGKNGNLFMVGDEDQSIYAFRAAYPNALLNFEKNYENATVLKLEQNYRSTPEIVNLANKLIARNRDRYPKNMFTENEAANSVDYHWLPTRSGQYKAIISDILPRLEGTTAILYRNNYSAIPYISELLSRNIPFSCRGEYFGPKAPVLTVR